MDDELEQEIVETEGNDAIVSNNVEEDNSPLISRNHSNSNNYASRSRDNLRNNNNRRTHGTNLGRNGRTNSNNNPLSRQNNSQPKGNNNLNNKSTLANRNARSNGGRTSNYNRNSNSQDGNNKSAFDTSLKNDDKKKGLLNKFDNDASSSSNVEEEQEGKLKIKIPLALKIKIALIGLAILAFLLVIMFLVALVMVIFGSGSSFTTNLNTDENLKNKGFCKELEVTFYKKIEENGTTRYEINEEVGDKGVATYDLETYVAGVVSGEVGVLKNEEVYKAFAVAARTYGLIRNTDCKIESSDRVQVMLPGIPAKKFRDAAKATEGEVLLNAEGNLIWATYDAFACYQKDEKFYYIKQGNIIPITWVKDNFPGMNSKWTSCTMQQAHGDGMSQYGAYYLAEVHGYTYQELLKYYYDDELQNFYCIYQLTEDSCDPNDANCEPVYEKVCE